MYNKAKVAEAIGKCPDLELMFQEETESLEFSVVKNMVKNEVKVISGQHPSVYNFMRLHDRRVFSVGDVVFQDAKILTICRFNVNDSTVQVEVLFSTGDVDYFGAGDLY